MGNDVWSGPRGIAGRVCPRHRHLVRPLNSVVSCHGGQMIIDLSQVFHDGMPGVLFRSESGPNIELTARIRPFMTHAQSCRHYGGKASFEITEATFQSSVGTKLDAPRHRYEG